MFSDIATGEKHPIQEHPEDYSLFRIGIFNDINAEITYEPRECLVTALEAVSNSRNVKKDQLELVTNDLIQSPGGTA